MEIKSHIKSLQLTAKGSGNWASRYVKKHKYDKVQLGYWTISSVIESIFEFIIHVVVNIFLIYTGEIIISICTFGTRPMPWNVKGESIMKSMIIFQFSFWVGFFFWIFTIGSIARWVSLEWNIQTHEGFAKLLDEVRPQETEVGGRYGKRTGGRDINDRQTLAWKNKCI